MMANLPQNPRPCRPRGIELFDELHQLEGKRFTSLETARTLLAALGNPQDKMKTVHIAGTNGKGTTCAIIGSILRAAGYEVGQTVSPHLAHVAERCLINGVPQREEEFSLAVEHVLAVAAQLDIAPGYFVLGIAAAFYEFARLRLDWAVVEVGLGGLHDATNLLAHPAATLITTISFDHTELLGRTLSEIARNKAGIAKRGVPMFVGSVPAEAARAIAEECARAGAPVEMLGVDFTYDEKLGLVRTAGGDLRFERGQLPLEGSFQTRNAVLAIRTAAALGIGSQAITAGLKNVRWPGRLEWIPEKGVLLDVAHNPEGIEALLDYLTGSLTASAKSKDNRESGNQRRASEVQFVVSIVGRKDWRTMLDTFLKGAMNLERCGIAVRFMFTHSGYTDAVPPEQLQEYFLSALAERNGDLENGSLGCGSEIRCSSCADPEEAIRIAVSSRPEDGVVVITGSLFLIGRVRALVTDEPIRSIAGE